MQSSVMTSVIPGTTATFMKALVDKLRALSEILYAYRNNDSRRLERATELKQGFFDALAVFVDSQYIPTRTINPLTLRQFHTFPDEAWQEADRFEAEVRSYFLSLINSPDYTQADIIKEILAVYAETTLLSSSLTRSQDCRILRDKLVEAIDRFYMWLEGLEHSGFKPIEILEHFLELRDADWENPCTMRSIQVHMKSLLDSS